MTMSSVKEIHQEAEKEREKNNLSRALSLINKAIAQYEKEEDHQGLCEALHGRVLIYKHLFYQKKGQAFAAMAEKDATESLRIVKQHKLSAMLAFCYFHLGEVAMLFNNFREAIRNYKMAIEHCRKENTEKGRYRYHLGEALFRNGQKEKGKVNILAGLAEIRANVTESDSFLIHVWESGCLLRLAELLRIESPAEARTYLAQAKRIINSDKRLIIRRKQLEKLSKIS